MGSTALRMAGDLQVGADFSGNINNALLDTDGLVRVNGALTSSARLEFDKVRGTIIIDADMNCDGDGWNGDIVVGGNTLQPGLYLADPAIGGGTILVATDSDGDGQPDTCTDYVLTRPVPGLTGQVNRWAVTGATPGEKIFFAYGLTAGQTSVLNCPGLRVDIDTPKVFAEGTADENGLVIVSTFVPDAASGLNILFQSAEFASCRVTPLQSFTF